MLLTVTGAANARPALYAAVTLLAALMLFMGGRIIVPSAAGARYRQGERLTARVQPRLEATMLLCFIPAVAGLAAEPLRPLAAIGAGGAGIVALVRLMRWQLWRCRGRPDLWNLGIGYGWVCAGLLLLGSAWLASWPTPVAGLHAITVGGLGTLSLNVMGRTWLLRAKADPSRAGVLLCGSLLITLAAVMRIAAILVPMFALNWIAAVSWSLAFVTTLVGLSRPALAELFSPRRVL